MDVRAFGGYYGFTASLPYSSGFTVASGTSRVFAACRGLYLQNLDPTASKTLVVTLADAPNQPITISAIRDSQLLPISAIAISGTSTINQVHVLY